MPDTTADLATRLRGHAGIAAIRQDAPLEADLLAAADARRLFARYSWTNESGWVCVRHPDGLVTVHATQAEALAAFYGK